MFDAFMPHGHCYFWEPAMVWLQAGTNAVIGLSYMAISVTLAVLVRRVRDLPFKLVYLAFGVFIVACGFTHFMDVLVIWEPRYWLDASLRLVTAIASLGTAVMLPRLVPQALALADGFRAARDKGVRLETAYKDLGTLYEKTRELEQAKTAFFANVSHELRTPLALILGPTERLIAAARDESERRELSTIRRNARLLLRQVDDLLDVARLDARELRPRFAEVDAAELVRRVAGSFETLADSRGLALTVDAPATLPMQVDPDHLERILLNLLGNAFKFTPPGGRVACALRGLEAEGTARLTVDDSGPGVPVEARAQVFERFRQLDPGSARRPAGAGLGLAIVRDLVDQHGGRIAVVDAPGGGARFEVVLPRKAPPGEPLRPTEGLARTSTPPGGTYGELLRESLRPEHTPPPAPVATPAPGAGGAVLVIEDNPDLNAFLVSTLAPDHRVTAALDGASGLARAAAEVPDLVVTDLMMPGMSGEQVLAAMRSDERLRDVPVLMVTARAEPDVRLRLLRSGAQDYVTKPFSPQELRARAATLVRARRARVLLEAEVERRDLDLDVLAHEVAERGRAVRAALAEAQTARATAEDATRQREHLLRLFSHELRTPLMGLKLLLQPLAQGADEARARLVRRLDRAVDRLAHLVRGVFDLLQLQTGAVVVTPEAVDVGALARAVVAEVAEAAAEKGLTLTVTVAPDTPAACADATHAHDVLRHLLDNAVGFTAAGGVSVHVGPGTDGVTVDVADTGPGIPPALRARAFEPFAHGEPLEQKHTPGVGVGLALARGLAERMGGAVELRPQGGARKYLPARVTVAGMSDVLVVDDDDDIRDGVAILLESRGYRVHTAVHGAAALALLRSGVRPGVILLDLMMPVMNGWDFRAAQLADPELSPIPVVILTGDPAALTARRRLETDDILIKPCDLEVLLRRVAFHTS